MENAAAFAKKAKDLEAFRATVIDAASVGAGLWLSYLFVLFYLAKKLGQATRRMGHVAPLHNSSVGSRSCANRGGADDNTSRVCIAAAIIGAVAIRAAG